MNRILIICVSVLILSVSTFAQSEKFPCPTIQITGPSEITNPGATMTFSVNVKNEKVTSKLKYVWTISLGLIIEGQNTSIIKVATTSEMAGANVMAKVEIQGLPIGCANEFSEVAGINNPPTICPNDDYGKISWSNEAGRLDSLFTELTNTPETVAFINIFRGANETIENSKKRIEKIVKHANLREFPKRRLVFAIDKDNSEWQRTVIFIYFENKLPECENCEIIKGEDVN